jgi:hypothetical protein
MIVDLKFDTGSNDKLIRFCKGFMSRNGGILPISEKHLAREFVEYFELPPFIQIKDLMQFCSATNIELLEEELPKDLLGINGSLGSKRQIVFSGRSQDVFFQEHTVLHEIREIIEYVFRNLGLPTVEPNEREFHANWFASYVIAFGPQNKFKTLIENSTEVPLGCFGMFSLMARAYLCAIYPRHVAHESHNLAPITLPNVTAQR